MTDETPEQIKERVLAEELAKGSDPRVAEGRAKAAEARARQGLPIEPDQAWRAKLEQEGGAPSAPAAAPAPAPEPAAPAPSPEEPEAPAAPLAPTPASEPSAEESETPAAPEPEAASTPPVETVPEAPAASPAPAPSAEPEPAPTAPAPSAEPEFEPEIGEPAEVESDDLDEYAGIKVRESRLPVWLMVILVAIPLWAIFYLAAFSGSESVTKTTGCDIKADHTFVCFER